MGFLYLYKAEPTIWNPLHESHQDKNVTYDAYKRIQTSSLNIDVSLKVLKKKKENLIPSFQKPSGTTPILCS